MLEKLFFSLFTGSPTLKQEIKISSSKTDEPEKISYYFVSRKKSKQTEKTWKGSFSLKSALKYILLFRFMVLFVYKLMMRTLRTNILLKVQKEFLVYEKDKVYRSMYIDFHLKSPNIKSHSCLTCWKFGRVILCIFSLAGVHFKHFLNSGIEVIILSRWALLIPTFSKEGKQGATFLMVGVNFWCFFSFPVSFYNCSLNHLGFIDVVPLPSGWPFNSFLDLAGSLCSHSR